VAVSRRGRQFCIATRVGFLEGFHIEHISRICLYFHHPLALVFLFFVSSQQYCSYFPRGPYFTIQISRYYRNEMGKV
jgi:hypothetical protein